jgi:hypothetical protein
LKDLQDFSCGRFQKTLFLLRFNKNNDRTTGGTGHFLTDNLKVIFLIRSSSLRGYAQAISENSQIATIMALRAIIVGKSHPVK